MTRGHYRHTKIVATLGPSTDEPEQLEKLILAGVDVIRLNMAHATEEWVLERVRRIREVSAKIGRQVAVMMDVKGPEIRTGAIAESIDLAAGEEFAFYTRPPTVPVRGVAVNYAGLASDVTVGSVMLVDSGLIRFEVMAKDEFDSALPGADAGAARVAPAHQSAGGGCESARADGEGWPGREGGSRGRGGFFCAVVRAEGAGRAGP